MTREMVPWIFCILLMLAGMILATVHAESMKECAASKTILVKLEAA